MDNYALSWLLWEVRYMYFAFYLYGVTLALLEFDTITFVWSVLLEKGVLNYVEVENDEEEEDIYYYSLQFVFNLVFVVVLEEVAKELLILFSLSLSSLINELSLQLSLCALWYLFEERLDSNCYPLSISSH